MFRRLALSTCIALQAAHFATAADLAYEYDDQGVTVTIGGELFTRYVFQSGTKPVLYPVIGPGGQAMTRSFPIEETLPDESKDHPHHRSVWFGYQGLNGADFWLERDEPDQGRQVHQELNELELSGDGFRLVTSTDYVDADDNVVAKDQRTMLFGHDDATRWIDCQIRLWSPQGPLEMADTKEGAFAVRVAGTMKVDAGKGGRYINSQGQANGKAWGQPAQWVDYTGPVDEQTVGILMMAHPSSLSATPRWHVREYGLFAANPIGAADYSGGTATGGLRRAEGEAIVLRHRIVLHGEDFNPSDVYADYAKSK